MPTLHLLPRVEMAQLTSQYEAVNLGQGFPDFPPPDFAVEAFRQAVTGDFMLNQYTRGFVSLPAALGPLRGPWGREGQGPGNSV